MEKLPDYLTSGDAADTAKTRSKSARSDSLEDVLSKIDYGHAGECGLSDGDGDVPDARNDIETCPYCDRTQAVNQKPSLAASGRSSSMRSSEANSTETSVETHPL